MSRPAHPLTVRPATQDDAAEILACLHAAFDPYRELYTAGAFEDTVPALEGIHQRLATMSGFVATTAEGEIVGTISHQVMGDGEGHIRGMAVRPEWQGTGAADQLLQSLEADMRTKGCTHASLDTTEPLARAVRFYLRNGFRPTGKVSDFFGMPLFQYVKRLGP